MALSHDTSPARLLPDVLADWELFRRALASWKEFVALSKEKRIKVQKASKACFASSLQRAWTTWQAIVHRHKLLRRALESRQVGLLSPFCLPRCLSSCCEPLGTSSVMTLRVRLKTIGCG